MPGNGCFLLRAKGLMPGDGRFLLLVKGLMPGDGHFLLRVKGLMPGDDHFYYRQAELHPLKHFLTSGLHGIRYYWTLNIMKRKIFAISGSLRAGSSNHAILNLLGKMMPAGINYTIYNGLSTIPAFDPGLDNGNPPAPVVAFRQQIAEADTIVICTPEYAYGVPGALKNALDWTVTSASFSGKPTALITASTGGENAHGALIKTLGAIDADLIKEATLLISFVRSKMDSEGNITDEESVIKLRAVFDSLLKKIGY
jgi:chromate reductase